MNAEAVAHPAHRKGRAMLSHKRVTSLAQHAAAFFKMSRSSVILANSRLSLRFSASWSTDDACDAAFAYSFIHV